MNFALYFLFYYVCLRVRLFSFLCMAECLYESVQAESCWEVADISVWQLSGGAAFWAGDGCVEAAVGQSFKTSSAVDMIAWKLLRFLKNIQTERASHLFFQHFFDMSFGHGRYRY